MVTKYFIPVIHCTIKFANVSTIVCTFIFSALLYLNDNFQGGEFFFTDEKMAIQVKIFGMMFCVQGWSYRKSGL